MTITVSRRGVVILLIAIALTLLPRPAPVGATSLEAALQVPPSGGQVYCRGAIDPHHDASFEIHGRPALHVGGACGEVIPGEPFQCGAYADGQSQSAPQPNHADLAVLVHGISGSTQKDCGYTFNPLISDLTNYIGKTRTVGYYYNASGASPTDSGGNHCSDY